VDKTPGSFAFNPASGMVCQAHVCEICGEVKLFSAKLKGLI